MHIKLHLETEELGPVTRTATAFTCKVEDILYVALDEYMTRLGASATSSPGELDRKRSELLAIKETRPSQLPLWADSAYSVHNYEGGSPDFPSKSAKSAY